MSRAVIKIYERGREVRKIDAWEVLKKLFPSEGEGGEYWVEIEGTEFRINVSRPFNKVGDRV